MTPRLWLLAALCLSAPAPQEAPREDVATRLEAIRAEAELPALGAIRVTLDGVEGPWVVGTRRAGGEERAAPDDLWHLGSCTKSMTATLIALLVKRGDLAWDAPLGELLPDLATEMHVDYLDLTLVELLNHRAGLVANPPADIGYGAADAEDLVALRDRLTRALLELPPVHPPRGGFLYSNAGFMVAGHCAEVAAGRSWEDLMRELLFEPLGMKSAGFGSPGSPDVCSQPRGHGPDGTPVEPGPGADNPPAIGPAGTAHASLEDWARYVRLHLAGERGDVKVGEITLTRDDFAFLHSAYEAPGQPYAFGWLVMQRPWAGEGQRALFHNGSNTMWYCVAWLGLDSGVAALVTTNRFDPRATAAVDQVASLLLVPEAAPASGR